MITALMLCGYLASAHLATACHATKDPHGATMVLQSTGAPAMLVYNPEPGAIDTVLAVLQRNWPLVSKGDWVGVALVTSGEMPIGVSAWVETLDAAVQYAAAVRQDSAHLRDAKAAHDVVGCVTWGERLGEDRHQLGVASATWRDVTGRALPAMPVRTIQE